MSEKLDKNSYVLTDYKPEILYYDEELQSEKAKSQKKKQNSDLNIKVSENMDKDSYVLADHKPEILNYDEELEAENSQKIDIKDEVLGDDLEGFDREELLNKKEQIRLKYASKMKRTTRDKKQFLKA
jgi:hypothetical protein